VREGTILPIGPDIQYTDQKPADPLTVYIYSGKDGEFTLYEDEGTNYNYEKGSFSTIRFSFNEVKK
jgi:alpha-D-xyloside xylohydrolase